MLKSSKVVLTIFSWWITATVSVNAAAPALYTAWLEFRFSHAECMSRAYSAVRATGLITGFEVVGTSTFGERTDYTASIRCIEGKNLVFFVVTGPIREQCAEIGKSLEREFRMASPNRP
jgi:hypothetical protein